MRLFIFHLLVVVGVAAEAAAHPLFSHLSSAGETQKTTSEINNGASRRALVDKSAARSQETAIKRDISAVARRRKRRLYGASREKGSWRQLLSPTTANNKAKVRTQATSRTTNVWIDPSGDRQLQTENTALFTCQNAIPVEEGVGAEFGTVCQCAPDFIQLTATLKCRDSACAYCNSNETVCTGYSYGVVFDKNGDDIGYYEEDVYRIGREGTIRYSEKDGACSVTIGGIECAQCSVVDCSDGYVGVAVSCGNVEKGAVYNSCKDDFSTVGIFEAFNENEFETCYNNSEVCNLARETLDRRFACSCENDPNNVDLSLLKCEDSCEHCNGPLDICGKETYEQTYQNAMSTASKRTVQYTTGRSELVEYGAVNCDPTTGCQECFFKVDGVACESCSIQTCANGTKAPLVQCSNIDVGLPAAVDFCTVGSLSGSVLEFFEANFTDSCVSKKEVACREAKTQYESNEQKLACDCIDQVDGSIELQCQSTCGDLCNDEETVCVRESFSQDFLGDGSSSFFRNDTKYTRGRKETMSYIEFTDGSCSMLIDGVGCSSCIINTCTGNTQVERAALIDCSDFEGGGVLDLCDADLRVETGIFEPFSIQEFQECMDRTPTNGVCETNTRITEMPHQTTGTTLMVPYDNVESCGSAQSFAPGLWYTVVGTGKGIEASVCEPEADFDAQISVYTGLDCKNVTCASATNKSCKLDWMADEGRTYYIRVHGIRGQIGNFDLSVREFNYGSVECGVKKAFFENNPELVTSCHKCEAPDADGQVHLHCLVDCNTCDLRGSVCANQTVSTIFDNAGHITLLNRNYQYLSGRDENMTVTTFNCSDPDDCQTCEVTIDKTKCESCQVIDCTGESTKATKGVVVTCGSSTINSCEDADFENADVLRPLVDSTYDKCFSRDPMVACLDSKAFEQDLEGAIMCDCESVGETANIRLVCRKQTCLHCNQERNICGFDAFGSVFDGEHGRITDRFEGFQYVQGRHDLVAYHVSNDVVAQANGTCTMIVGDEQCDSCMMSQCPDEGEEEVGQFHGVIFDCQNIPGGLFYDGCSMLRLPETFEFITSPSFEDCVPVASPEDACQTLMVQTMVSRTRQRDFCNCNLTETGFYELICTDQEECRFCLDDSETTCADYTEHRVEINDFGASVARVESYQWESGRDELLVVRENELECQITVNGEPCSSCAYKTCTDNSRGFSINCQNVVANATFECGTGHEIFAPISDSAVYTCPEDTPTVFPTMNPAVLSNAIPQIKLIVDQKKSESFCHLPSIALITTTCAILGVMLL